MVWPLAPSADNRKLQGAAPWGLHTGSSFNWTHVQLMGVQPMDFRSHPAGYGPSHGPWPMFLSLMADDSPGTGVKIGQLARC